MFKHGNYIARLEVDPEAGILHGKVLNISDTVAFQGENVREAEQDFHRAVEAYIQACKAQGKEPEKPFSGKLPFRTTPEIHRDIYIAATRADKSINAWMEDILSHAAKHFENKITSPPTNQEGEISIKEYEQLLARLTKKLSQLEDQVKRHLDQKPGSFDYFFKDLKPFLTDRELPELIEKVESFHERLKSIQAQETPFLAFLLSSEQVPEKDPRLEKVPETHVASSALESSVAEDMDTILESSRIG